MSRASLTIDPLPTIHPTARLIVLDCPHGRTRCAFAAGDGDYPLSEDDAVRMALVRHYGEEQCRCIRCQWASYFPGCALGEVPLVRSI